MDYPSFGPCNYLALSYMWGTVGQKSYDLGDILDVVPPTIEDAITVMKKLGERYLWVDSICINQASREHKQSQVKMMDIIYGGARATIVSLSRSDADFGLCRVQTCNVIPSHMLDEKYHSTRCQQTRRSINGEEYVTLLPTLEQQIQKSRWRYRGWTLQEALLSPRCLFFSCEQVYFQCNTIQCCESLDDSHHPIFSIGENPVVDNEFFDEVYPTSIMEDYPVGSFINPFTAPGKETTKIHNLAKRRLFDQLSLYDYLLSQYSGRELTRDSDAIEAFMAILQKFQQKSGSEVFWGLPTVALPWTLLWEEENFTNRRRGDFPSWSWAGW